MHAACHPARVFLRQLTLCAVSLALALPSQAGVLFGVGQVLDEVYTIDTATGEATLLGTLPEDNFVGIAFDGLGVLHGVDGDFFGMRFWELDGVAETATLIGDTGGDSSDSCLAYDSSSGLFYTVFYGTGGDEQELAVINPSTGVGTIIGNLGLATPSAVVGLTFLPDGTLLGYDSNGLLPSRLLEIDPSTGTATVINDDIGIDPAGSLFGGMAFDVDTNTLYVSAAVELWTVDPTTGVGTLVGSHGIIDLMNGLTVLTNPPSTCLLGLDLTSTLWDVDPLTGAGSNPRSLGASKFGGLAMDDSGALFGLRAAPTPELHAIDPWTGSASLIGPLGILHSEGGLDFDPTSGLLYGVGGSSELFEVDTATGNATIVGPLLDEFASPIDPSAMAFDVSGTLFVLKAASSPPELYQVDPADGSVLDRVPLSGLPLAWFGGMDFDDATGELMLSYADRLFRANPFTGATVLVGPTPPLFSALEVTGPCAVPPPFTLRPAAALAAPPANWGG